MHEHKTPRRPAYGTVIALALLFCLEASAQQKPSTPPAPPAPAQGDLSKLADGVYAQIVIPDGDAVSNSGIVVLDSGVLVFDTHFTPEAGDALLEKIKAVTPRPVRYVVNSHFHSDHTHGNQSFAAARLIIAGTNARRDMLQKDLATLNQMQVLAQGQVEQLSKEIRQEQDARAQEALRAQLNQRLAFMRRMSALKILVPGMTIDDGLSLMDGSSEVDLITFGPGHTDGDMILYLPQEKIAFLGDLFFNDALPNVDDAHMLDWMKALREALKLDATTFVPGHGQVGGKADVERFLGYFEDLKSMVEPAVTRGDTLEQVVRDLRLPAKYSNCNFQNFFLSNLQKMYAELKASLPAPAVQEGVKKQGW
jgi:cyclase